MQMHCTDMPVSNFTGSAEAAGEMYRHTKFMLSKENWRYNYMYMYDSQNRSALESTTYVNYQRWKKNMRE